MRSQDLINVGAYQAGSDPILDEAIARNTEVQAFLQQDIAERADVAHSLQQLGQILA